MNKTAAEELADKNKAFKGKEGVDSSDYFVGNKGALVTKPKRKPRAKRKSLGQKIK